MRTNPEDEAAAANREEAARAVERLRCRQAVVQTERAISIRAGLRVLAGEEQEPLLLQHRPAIACLVADELGQVQIGEVNLIRTRYRRLPGAGRGEGPTHKRVIPHPATTR